MRYYEEKQTPIGSCSFYSKWVATEQDKRHKIQVLWMFHDDLAVIDKVVIKG